MTNWEQYRHAEQSPRIGRLAADLLSGHPTALADFWAEVEASGAPLIEAYNAQTRQCLVTFLWREPGVGAAAAGAAAAGAATVVEAVETPETDDTDEAVGEDADAQPTAGAWPAPRHLSVELSGAIHLPEWMDRYLQRLGETDVWFRTLTLRSDLRMGYAFMLDRAGAHQWPGPGEPSPMHADPFNPDRFAEGTDLPGVWGGGPPDASSTLALPDAEPLPWLERRRAMPRGEVTQHELRSEILGNTRQVWVSTPEGYEPEAAEAYDLLVILDGERCLQPLGVPMLLDALQEAGEIRPTVAVMVGNVERGTELPCHQPFADCLARELLPWVASNWHVTQDPARTVIAGLSYGGLAAAFIGLRYPQHFGNVLSQSGSFWWRPTDRPGSGRAGWSEPISAATSAQGWLTAEYMRQPTQPLRIWMETGIFESHGSSALPTPLNSANQHLRDVLLLKGYDVTYREYVGGHDYSWWRGSLAEGIRHLLGSSAEA